MDESQHCAARGLAVLLDRREHKHRVQVRLRPLVAQGLLAHTIPTMEKHPEQRDTARPAA